MSAWLRRRAGALLVFLLLFLAWELAVRLFGIKEYLLPPPTKVWTEFVKRYDPVMASAWVTTQEILAGFALAVVVSIPLAAAISYSRFMENAVYPAIVFLQIIPKIAIAPLFIIWFGFGFTPKLLLVFLLSFFPIVVAAIAGFKSVDPDIIDFARTTGAGRWRLVTKIRDNLQRDAAHPLSQLLFIDVGRSARAVAVITHSTASRARDCHTTVAENPGQSCQDFGPGEHSLRLRRGVGHQRLRSLHSSVDMEPVQHAFHDSRCCHFFIQRFFVKIQSVKHSLEARR